MSDVQKQVVFNDRELLYIVSKNNLEALEQILAESGLTEMINDTLDLLFMNRRVAKRLLMFAALAAGRNQLAPVLARRLVDTISPYVNIKDILSLVVAHHEPSNVCFTQLPPNVQSAIEQNHYGFAEAIIPQLRCNEFLGLANYLIDKPDIELSYRFNHVFLRYIHKSGLLSTHELLTYMSCCLITMPSSLTLICNLSDDDPDEE